ncbi:glycosyltransferase family 39 protein [Nocardia sp. alder85J]|uniref:glycosyltransferase family 39 protein n=1 Tax=Nocardia sp. alder85J TaxID=2862949 RepID=UPI001CD54A1B|nr:glycosyltransferase family 39 protein [Nocardia sp. alder85J]MCX4094132.1 glycosyltransferase family 39 protein [Nocardia sp. alder85J]
MDTVIASLDTSTVQPQPAAPRATGRGSKAAERAGLAALLLATAVMYLWNITINGMGNQFYAGAAWAGSRNWEALLFGSLDAGNFITVDKPPVSQWVMGLSGRIFGFSSASMLIPQALMAVAAVALLYGAIRRVTGSHYTGLLAGAALALIPVAALMFRFNNPDAAMVLLMMAGAYATVRAIQRASTLWIVLAGVAIGFAFLAKMLEGVMVLPALGLAYLIAAPNPLRTRILQLVAALVATLVAAGWYVVLTLLWPASSRPYLAGSTDNNFMNLVLGYNGFARVLGRNRGGGGGRGATPPANAATPAPGAAGHAATAVPAPAGRGGGGFGGNQVRGVERLFSGEFGFEIGWLLPAALLALVLVLIARRHAPRTDLVRAGAIVFGGWVVVDGGVLSYMKNLAHPYYTLSIAPAVAGMFAIGIHEMWIHRHTLFGRLGLAALIALTGIWSFVLLHRNSGWYPELRWAILLVTLFAAALAVMPWDRGVRRVAAVALTLGLIGSLAGPAAYSLATVATAHSGGGPTVGPARAGGRDGFGGFGQTQSNPQLSALLGATTSTWAAAVNGSSTAAGLEIESGRSVMAIGGFSGSDPTPTLAQFQADVKAGKVTYYIVSNQGGRGQTTGGATDTRDGTAGSAGAGNTRTGNGTTGNGAPGNGRAAGNGGAGNAAPGSGTANNGGAGNAAAGGGGGFGRNQHTDISDWVTANFTPQQVGNTTVYNLSGYTG